MFLKPASNRDVIASLWSWQIQRRASRASRHIPTRVVSPRALRGVAEAGGHRRSRRLTTGGMTGRVGAVLREQYNIKAAGRPAGNFSIQSPPINCAPSFCSMLLSPLVRLEMTVMHDAQWPRKSTRSTLILLLQIIHLNYFGLFIFACESNICLRILYRNLRRYINAVLLLLLLLFPVLLITANIGALLIFTLQNAWEIT